jgi:hypothetical protein
MECLCFLARESLFIVVEPSEIARDGYEGRVEFYATFYPENISPLICIIVKKSVIIHEFTTWASLPLLQSMSYIK